MLSNCCQIPITSCWRWTRRNGYRFTSWKLAAGGGNYNERHWNGELHYLEICL